MSITVGVLRRLATRLMHLMIPNDTLIYLVHACILHVVTMARYMYIGSTPLKQLVLILCMFLYTRLCAGRKKLRKLQWIRSQLTSGEKRGS